MNTSRSKAIVEDEQTNERKPIELVCFLLKSKQATAARHEGNAHTFLSLCHFHFCLVFGSILRAKNVCVHIVCRHTHTHCAHIHVLKCNYFCLNWCSIHQLLRPRRFSFWNFSRFPFLTVFRFTATVLLRFGCCRRRRWCLIRASQTTLWLYLFRSISSIHLLSFRSFCSNHFFFFFSWHTHSLSFSPYVQQFLCFKNGRIDVCVYLLEQRTEYVLSKGFVGFVFFFRFIQRLQQFIRQNERKTLRFGF